MVVGFTTNKTNRHNIGDLLLKVELKIITPNNFIYIYIYTEEKTIGLLELSVYGFSIFFTPVQ